MFVGHYGPSFAARTLEKTLPLWLLFIAVQFLDVVWGVLVLVGVEKVRIAPGITATNPLDLYYMPYTHGLVTAVLWSLAVTVGYRAYSRVKSWKAPAILGLAVFSHWVLDLLVHRPDLPLYDNTWKVGLGIWNYPVLASALEVGVLFGGMVLYLRGSRARSSSGKYGMILFGVVMVAMQGVVFFGPPPPSDKAIAVTALTSYFGFAAVVYWLERKRE